MSNPISAAGQPAEAFSDVQAGRLRRELEGKFREMEQVIARVVLQDPLTVEIEGWLNSFRINLRRHVDERAVYRAHIEVLQRLLCDSFNEAPLDVRAWLGVEDGCTYGSMTVAVMRAAFPDHDVSPTTEQPLTLVPHPVARFMAAWLEQRGESLYSPELVEAYFELLPQEPEAEAEARLQARVDDVMQMHIQRQAQNQEEELNEWQRLEARARRMEQQHDADVQRVAERIARLTEPLQQVQHEVQQIASQSISIPAVRRELQRIVDEPFRPLEQRVRNYASAHVAQLTQVAEQERQRLAEAEETIRSIENRVNHVQTENASLAQEQEHLQQNMTQLGEQQRQLDHDIHELHQAIDRKIERQQAGLWRAVACVAFSVLTTWGLSCLNVPLRFNLGSGSAGFRMPL